MLNKKKEYIFCFVFGAYIAAVLWITLFSRIGDEYRGFLLPFHSYVEIWKGEWRPLLENIGNIALFIPLGVALKCSCVRGVKKAGFLASLLIEVLQFTFALGTFECDDLIHNTLGAVIGAWCVGKIGGEIRLNGGMRKVVLLSMVLCSAVPFSYREIQHQKMVRMGRSHRNTHPMYGKIICAQCGSPYTRKTYQGYGDKGNYHAWICSGKRKGSKCASRSIREEALMHEIQEQMGWNSDEMAIDDILKVEVGNQEVVVHRK